MCVYLLLIVLLLGTDTVILIALAFAKITIFSWAVFLVWCLVMGICLYIMACIAWLFGVGTPSVPSLASTSRRIQPPRRAKRSA